MRWTRIGASRRLLTATAAILTVWCFAIGALLPYDNQAVLFVRFTAHRLLSLFPSSFAGPNNKVLDPAGVPLDLGRDIAFIIKTGYGTQRRASAQWDALIAGSGNVSMENILVVADFAARVQDHGGTMRIHDVVARMIGNVAMARFSDSNKLVKYTKMSKAIEEGDHERALAISTEVGWALDALKAWICGWAHSDSCESG